MNKAKGKAIKWFIGNVTGKIMYAEGKEAYKDFEAALDIAIKESKKEVNELLLDVLNQVCGDGDGEIDNQCLSAYEDACDYLKKEELLEEVNSRIYNIVDSSSTEGTKK